VPILPRGAKRANGDGLSNTEIGARMFVSQSTVAYHVRNLFSKLNIASRHQLTDARPDADRSVHVAI
jgi:DNA-binding NarL/FixJ family response regulator